jgi:two-component system LytT family response regulator
MFKTIIVEDELHSRELLKSMVDTYCKQLNVVAVASSVEEGVEAIKTHDPAIVFMDIEMQTGTGFDVLQQTTNYNFHVIFTTAYDHYAIKAIKFSAVDYLLKPIDLEELQDAATKAVEKINKTPEHNNLNQLLKNLRRPPGEDYSITLSTSDGLEFTPLTKIIRIEANGPYSIFHLKDGRKIMVSKNLKEYEMLLEDHNFMRVHNSHIINLDEVRKMVKTDGGYVVLKDETQIIISPKKKDEFMQRINERMV